MTITPADAQDVIAVITACHHRTAPRMEDPEAARATATVWAELLSGYDFTVPELIAAVKSRAQTIPDAPEPADLIRVARAARNDELATTTEFDGSHDGDGYYPGDEKAAEDPADYPADWDGERRTAAYWFAVKNHIKQPTQTAGWVAIDEKRQQAADETRARIRRLRDKLAKLENNV